MSELIYQSSPWVLPLVMLIALGLAIELPYRFAGALAGKMTKTDASTALQAGLLTLASFVLGLSFSQASARFDSRRALVVTEANDIGTTWLRADQLGSPQSALFRNVLSRYTAARLKAYETPHDMELYRQVIDESNRDQGELWSMVSSALRRDRANLGYSLLMQSLNDTIDVSAEQLQALTSHVPTSIVVLTLVLVTLGALSLGFRFALDRSRPLALSAIYVFALLVVINMMVDYDRPQTGFVKVSLAPLQRQLQSMQH
jgi:hypothetical protein